MTEKIILAGGCFWGMEELFRAQKGVTGSRVGYTGGTTANPTYNSMKAGGHAEAIELTYDPSLTDYKTLLHFFFQIHDATTPMRQGNDIGSQYRSAIFYLSEEQRQVAEDVIKTFDESRKLPGKIVTEVVPAGEFYVAEESHQNYLQKHPDGYTCHWVRPNWAL